MPPLVMAQISLVVMSDILQEWVSREFGAVASSRESIDSPENLDSFILFGPEMRVFIFFR